MKQTERWYSERVGQHINLARWGHLGQPVLVFPTAGGDYEEIERFLMIDVLSSLMEAGRIKVYSVDSINGSAWLSGEDPRHAAWLQSQFDAALRHEVVPAIRADCRAPDIEVIAAGASIGAFNALALACRHPDVISAAICLSGTYDLSKWAQGVFTSDFYYTSPVHYLPDLQSGAQLDRLRQRFVLLAHGTGRYEEPEESWRVADLLGRKGVPNRVDEWHSYPHDWVTWREMLPRYVDELVPHTS